MRVGIHDRRALLAASPSGLSAYARTAGWRRHEPYRAHSDVYVGEDRPDAALLRESRGLARQVVRQRATILRVAVYPQRCHEPCRRQA